jgi:CRISPR/Cas system CSM-associated protein Csm3 (group 7 of RAMP superfamily)
MIPAQFDIAHVTITFTSPMLVATGDATDLTDAVCMQDSNGFPTIPGTSITGALRHAFARVFAEKIEQRVFGYTGGASTTDEMDGARSLLTVSWAHVHDSKNRPVSHAVCTQSDDAVLNAVRTGVFRDNVRIDEVSGTAEKGGKFDQTLVPRGVRFTFALMLDTGQLKDTPVTMQTLVGLMHRPDFFLGGKSRRGLGRFEVSEVRVSSFDLNNPTDYARFAAYSFDVSAPYDFESTLSLGEESGSTESVTKIHLTAKDFLLPGGGVGIASVFDAKHDKQLAERLEHADMYPVFEPSIVWNAQGGRVSEPQFYLPSTSIKGTLRHRTLFYTRILLQEWGQPENYPKHALSNAEQLMNLLFGTTAENGVPGLVYISEPIFATDTSFRVLQHVSLDRFTQGPMRSALFGEVLLEMDDQPFDVDVFIDWDRLDERCAKAMGEKKIPLVLPEGQSGSDILKKAWNRAVIDLIEGRLSLGAAGSRGHGLMNGKIEEVAQ